MLYKASTCCSLLSGLSDHLQGYKFDEDFAWRKIHQIAQGLGLIHDNGTVHRDLTPKNIFFDAKGDVKIGDFGLDVDVAGSRAENTRSEDGAFYYKAPEIGDHSVSTMDQKLWHLFTTGMGRVDVLTKLKNNELPPKWVSRFSQHASLLQRLVSRTEEEKLESKKASC
ncbi:unnamed protein product [Arabis nemorensis]|uniref:Protein kinase domain-containing protein n=1 Tax=Arabis nemorensis TaxID=586526 RepID=A0A565BRJ9_9BRAS|nr:unnamed protein product [Arabis nemorensis]